MLPNYILLLIELPQTKLGLNDSEMRVTGQMGEVYETRRVGGIPDTHKTADKYKKLRQTHRACYLEGAIHRKWEVININKLVRARKGILGKCISTGWKSLSSVSSQHGACQPAVTAPGKSFRS